MHRHIDPHLNILWLSDIHYHKNYKDKEYHKDLREYLDSFKSYVNGMEVSFDYILLSGDIAQNGDAADYDLFDGDILGPLQTMFPDAKLLVIPGNHDVARKKISFVEAFITGTETQKVFFENNQDKFLEVFAPYSQHFRKNTKFPDNASYQYSKDFLYGHVVDKKYKTIFVLLNSAWYSFGETFLEYYLEEKLYEKKSKAADIKKEITKITSEYGKQMLALEMLEEVDAILDLLRTYPEYLVITTMHHPISWLGKFDQVTKTGGKFHGIKNHTDVMLTGHEHVHLAFPYEFLNNNRILHLKAGCFAEYSRTCAEEDDSTNYLNPFSIKNNWFSTLKINTKKRTIGHHKHVYDSVNKNWHEAQENYNLLNLNKKHEVDILDHLRLAPLRTKIMATPALAVNHVFASAVPSHVPDIYALGHDAVIFIPLNEIDFDSSKIKSFFHEGGERKLYVVLVDLFNDKSIDYSKQRNRIITAGNIKKDYDFKFNNFRHDFFSKLSDIEVPIFGNLIFISKVIPFWDLEN